MDKLDEIFLHQSEYEKELYALRDIPANSKDEWVQKLTLAIMVELGELVEEVNYRWWKNEKPVDEDKIKDELADVLHFFVSMCLKLGIDADELHRVYMRKNEENVARQHGKSAKEGYAVSQD